MNTHMNPLRRSLLTTNTDTAGLETLEARALLTVDFVAAFINSSSHSVAPGEDFTAAMVVNNDGNESAPGYAVQMRLSTDGIFGNADDIVLDTIDRPAGLGADSSTSIVRVFSIPAGTDPGSYFLAFSVDPTNAVSESNESNNVYFTPDALITVTEGGGGNVDLDVFGNSQEILDGAISPSADNHTFFGDLDVGQMQDRTFTLMNDGSGTLQILDVTIAGVNNLDFVIIGASTFTLGAGQTANLTIRFAPVAEGIRVANIQIQTNDSDDGTGDPSVFSFAISGNGHAVGEGDPEIEIRGNGQAITDGDTTPSPADFTKFDRLRLNDASQTRTFTIFNLGDATLTISNIVINGRNADQFTLLDDVDSIAPGESATFRVRFDPSSNGQKTAQVRVFSNDSDETEYNFKIVGRGNPNGGSGDGAAEIDVFGNGVSIMDGDTSPSAADDTGFGRVRQNGQTRVRTYTIANTGNDTLNIDSISLFGRDASNFVVLDTLTSIAAGETATFRVRFDPDGLGNRRADVRILSDDVDEGEFTFRVRGNGINGNPPQGGDGEITVAGLQIIEDGDTTPTAPEGSNFGRVTVGETRTRTFTITNTGSGVLNLTGPFVQITGPNAARFTIVQAPSSSSLAVGESTTFTVQFSAQGAGRKRATVEILSSDTDEAVFNFDILGRGRLA